MITATSTLKILLIEDNLAEARLLQEFIKLTKSQNFGLVHVQRLQDGINQLNSQKYDVILLDLTLPDSQGLSSIPQLLQQNPSNPIIVLTNTNDEELGIEAVRQGAQDYLVKRHVNPDTLVRSVRYAVERKQFLEELNQINQTLETQVEEKTTELLKSQEINQLKSEFMAMLSHDIRNPLNTILLAAGLIEKYQKELTNNSQIDYVQLIRSAIKNVSHLVDEASLIGKSDSGQLPYQPHILNLENLCSELVKQSQLPAQEQQLNLIFTSSEHCFEFLGDETLLKHVISNLLNNAIKYSIPGGTVLFELIKQEKSVILRFQDQGIGMSEKDQKKLFQPFHRGENIGIIPGSGLGLTIVQQCVIAHRGEITVNSQVGVGSTFTVTLPITK
ncbi:hybrid sensor histidine kinase/response regulator [Dolichospermum sp. LEGE 00240]|jgi:signal transduction histidine kinase|uniref:ATP-binding response regulator n=1 Tax=Dolichospermum sp. LEGE 00240 TaxID=1828603 RepID=UPI0018821450|nr:hybrid sensor histidine kinase/response regulator [Dolichospermum sp. LEGE 00240]MDM3844093.1 hybrid sensor histidine kinase/response regulator [Aphanizomenon gracile PMC638.10]MDM3848492.1 hybrid sensor histidine kinase/response regulator [Aphanizomenon gracile PMC627.10]MDM3857185.1 hybrid sensor histidine kinase/response regulator [Aphanizomenon gracile PMC649.10]MDM3858525.1 hybrid sensor histidine kinase/response regulator [Aphanizomenon gracile PMC644.10]MBE9251236.1 hybrid sensor his